MILEELHEESVLKQLVAVFVYKTTQVCISGQTWRKEIIQLSFIMIEL